MHHIVETWARANKQLVRYDNRNGILYLTGPEGMSGVMPGNYVIKDDEGEVYHVSARRFAKLYELVEIALVEPQPVVGQSSSV